MAGGAQQTTAGSGRQGLIELFRLEDVFGTWRQTQADHFNDGGVFDRIYVPSK